MKNIHTTQSVKVTSVSNIICFGFLGFIIFAFVVAVGARLSSKLFENRADTMMLLFILILMICVSGMGYVGSKKKVVIGLEEKADFYAQQALETALLSLVLLPPLFIVSLLLSNKALRMKTRKKGKTYWAVIIAVFAGIFWLFIANFSAG